MKLNVKALALAAGLVWGGAILMVALCNLAWPNYGLAFLEIASSIYPGYTPSGDVGSAVVGGIYGFFDGGIAGLIFGWLYNLIAR